MATAGVSLLPAPLEPTRPGLLQAAAPVTRLFVGIVWLLAAAVTVDPTVPARLCLAAVAALVLLSGLPLERVLRRLSPLIVAAAGLAVLTLLVHPSNADPSASAVVVGPLRLSAAGLGAAAALALRLAVIALTSVLVFGPSDATRLADSLSQHLRVPDRFAYGTLAALRIAPLVEHDWVTTGAARRIRGLEPSNPVSRLAGAPSRLLGLLVSAIRRAERMALAMDARGFDSGIPRSRYRSSRLGSVDAIVLLAGVAIAVAALLPLG